MPYINTTTSVKMTEAQEVALKAKLGAAIAIIPGKNESQLMLGFEDDTRMWFKGENDKDYAMVEVMILGKANPIYYKKLTEVICDAFNEELGIDKACVYVKFEEIKYWGCNGNLNVSMM